MARAGHAFDALASGPTLPDSTTVDECEEILRQVQATQGALPVRLANLVRAGLPETPKQWDACFARSHVVTVLSNEALLDAARVAAEAVGFRVIIDNGCDDFDYRDAAAYLLARAETEAAAGSSVCVLSGGEVTVQLPPAPGTGRRRTQSAVGARNSGDWSNVGGASRCSAPGPTASTA